MDVINPIVAAFTQQFPKQQLAKEGQARHVPTVPVNTPEDLSHDGQMAALGFFLEGDHPVLGRAQYAGAPYGFGKTPVKLYRTAPLLGQDNETVYGELGLGAEALAALRAEGVV